MPYVGRDLQRGNYLKLDDISSSFNGSLTTFNLTSGGNAFFPGSAFSIIVSLGGVIQEPESAFQIDRSQIIFATAPSPNDDFFCIVQGVSLGVGVPGHNTVNNDHLAKPLSYGDYFRWDSANNRVGINTLLPSTALDVVGSATFSGNVAIGGTLTYEDVANIDAVGIITARAGIEDKTLTAGRVVYVGTNGRLVDNSALTFNPTTLNVPGLSAAGVSTFTGNAYFGSDIYLTDDSGGYEKVEVGDNDIRVESKHIHSEFGVWTRSNSISDRRNGMDGDGSELKLYSNTTEKVRIKSDGKVGIGLTNPTTKLQVANGHVNISTGYSYQWGDSHERIEQSDGKIEFFTNNGQQMTLHGSNLGIGTDSPSGLLHVAKYTYDTPDNENFFRIKLQDQGGIMNDVGIGQVASGSLSFNNTASGRFSFHNGTNGEIFRIASSGSNAGGVGISTAGGNIGPDGNALLIRAKSSVGTNKGHIMLTGDGATNGEGPQIVFSESGSGSNFAGAYIGHIRATTNSVGHLVFGTRETGGDANTVPIERLRITSDGKVGIGTDAPTYPLQVHDSNAGGLLRLLSSHEGNYDLRFVYQNSETNIWSYGSTDLTFGTRYAKKLHLVTNGPGKRVTIDDGGRVGISTTSPGAQLHVKGSGEILRLETTASGGGQCYIDFDDETATRASIGMRGSSSDTLTIAALNGGLRFDTSGKTQAMNVAADGKVGINQATPATYQLEVVGSFAATTKSFVIDHPTKENHSLRYACLEGPENSVYVRGKTSNSVIELPDYWKGLVHDDSITVNVTPIGNHKVWVESINNNSVTIGSDGSEYFYTVFAERKDVEKLEVEVEK